MDTPLKTGDHVRKNPSTWVQSDFDSWGAGQGIGTVLADEVDGIVDVRWNGGRCHQHVNELLRATDVPRPRTLR